MGSVKCLMVSSCVVGGQGLNCLMVNSCVVGGQGLNWVMVGRLCGGWAEVKLSDGW